MQANEIQEFKRKLEFVSNGSIPPKADLTSIIDMLPMINNITNENKTQSPATPRASTPPKPLTEKEKVAKSCSLGLLFCSGT